MISRHSLTAAPRYFRIEWLHAVKQSRKFPGGFILPIVIDDTSPEEVINDTSPEEKAFPRELRDVTWHELDDQPIELFVDEVKRLFRRYQKAMWGLP